MVCNPTTASSHLHGRLSAGGRRTVYKSKTSFFLTLLLCTQLAGCAPGLNTWRPSGIPTPPPLTLHAVVPFVKPLMIRQVNSKWIEVRPFHRVHLVITNTSSIPISVCAGPVSGYDVRTGPEVKVYDFHPVHPQDCHVIHLLPGERANDLAHIFDNMVDPETSLVSFWIEVRPTGRRIDRDNQWLLRTPFMPITSKNETKSDKDV